MTEEVKETMLVMKRKNVSYASYYNAEKNKWGGLLEATIYTGNEVPNMEDIAEVVEYKKEVGLA
jgi:hypothetical protein